MNPLLDYVWRATLADFLIFQGGHGTSERIIRGLDPSHRLAMFLRRPLEGYNAEIRFVIPW